MEGRANSAERLPITVTYADDFHRMSARKLIYRFMVVAPAIFLAGIGVNARSLSTEFETVCNDARTDAAILAYVPYLREAEAPLRNSSPADLDRALSIGKHWIEAANKGRLKELSPVAYEDSSTEGAKSQIFDAKTQVVFRLLSGIEEAGAHGDYEKMADCATTAIRMSEILKYSDFVSLFNCTSEQRRATTEIRPYTAKLSSGSRKSLIEAMSAARIDTGRMDQLARLTRHLFLTWRIRNQHEPLSIEDTRLLSDIPVILKGRGVVALSDLRERMLATNDRSVPSYYSSVRLGISASQALNMETSTALRELKGEKATPVEAEPSH